MRAAGWILVLGLGAAATVRAEVEESVEYEHYGVDASEGPLRQALTAASPIREDGKTFHGHTQWFVKWRYWWDEDDYGCEINRVAVDFDATITLPELEYASDDNQALFDEYIEALDEHELGHVQNGRDAAYEVDAELMELGAMDSCAELETEANALGRRIVKRYNQADRDYDKETGHGRTQGAWLP